MGMIEVLKNWGSCRSANERFPISAVHALRRGWTVQSGALPHADGSISLVLPAIWAERTIRREYGPSPVQGLERTGIGAMVRSMRRALHDAAHGRSLPPTDTSRVMKAGPSAKRSPLTFFGLVYVLAIPFWLVGAATGGRLPGTANLPVSALQFVCPLIAGVMLVYREERGSGVRSLLRRILDYRRIGQKIWYLPALLLPPLVYLLSYGLMLLAGRPIPEPRISFLSIPLLFGVFFISGACEETGWMGYAADSLQERWSALATGMIIGMIWASWHAIPWLSVQTPAWVAGQFVSACALRILIVWLYNNAGGSVFAATLMHAVDNVSWTLFPNGGSHYDPAVTGALNVVAAGIVMLLWGSKTLARFKYARPQA